MRNLNVTEIRKNSTKRKRGGTCVITALPEDVLEKGDPGDAP